MKRDFKGIWIPKEVWLSKKLTLQEKLFYVEIDSLDNEDGCFASNAYFAEFFGIGIQRVGIIIKNLVAKKYISSDVNQGAGNTRILHTLYKNLLRPYPTKVDDPYHTKLYDPTIQSCMHNNTISNPEDKSMSGSEASPDVASIFDVWKQTLNHPRAIFDDKRKKILETRLKDGFSIKDLKLVPQGVLKSSWHMSAKVDAIKIIYRDAEQVERFIELANSKNGNNGKPTLTPEELEARAMVAAGRDATRGIKI